MMEFIDFLKMSPVERQEYIREFGLSIEEKKELLRVNQVIVSMIQADAYWAGRKQRFTVKKWFRWKW